MKEKTIAHYISDLTYDLKIVVGTELSTEELTRCVEKAVADLSRFLPDEKTVEVVVDAEVDDESFKTPAASDFDKYADNKDISAVANGTAYTAASGLSATTPDVPRPVLVTVTDTSASITSFTIIVKGRDTDGHYLEESFYFEDGLEQTGKEYFAYISEVEVDEMTGEGADDKLDVGTGSHLGVFVPLANKPIKFQSETITGYTRDVAYEMDYARGRIALKTGTTMVVATSYTIDYVKSRIDIDLEPIVPDLIRVDRVEYPTGSVPQNFSKFEMWGKVLTITGDVSSQVEMSDEEHAIIKYLAPHSPPDSQSPGSFPQFLNTTVQLAASAYALFILALKQEHQAVTDLGEMRTTLGYLGIGGVGANPLTLVYKAIDDALDKVVTYLAAAAGTNPDNAADRLAEISDMEAYLRDLIIKLSDGTGAIKDANDMLDKIATASIDKAVTGAEVLLDTGDDYIDAINDGENVPGHYRDYSLARAQIANTRVQAAVGYFQEVNARLAVLQSYIDEAGAWRLIGESFIAEAQVRVAEAQSYLAEAAQYAAATTACQYMADRFKAEGIERRNEAWAVWSSPNQLAAGYTLGQRAQTP